MWPSGATATAPGRVEPPLSKSSSPRGVRPSTGSRPMEGHVYPGIPLVAAVLAILSILAGRRALATEGGRNALLSIASVVSVFCVGLGIATLVAAVQPGDDDVAALILVGLGLAVGGVLGLVGLWLPSSSWAHRFRVAGWILMMLATITPWSIFYFAPAVGLCAAMILGAAGRRTSLGGKGAGSSREVSPKHM